MLTSFLPIFAFAAPLGTDSACYSVAVAARRRLMWRRRLLIAATLTGFEAGMPAIGMAIAGPAGHYLGEWTAYLAGGLLIVLGVWMLTHSDDGTGGDTDDPGSLSALLAVAVGLSVDEIAVGASLGLAGIPLLPLVATIAVWVFAATLTGLSLGDKLGQRFSGIAGTFAVVALIALGAAVATGIL